jgi:DNA-binding NtrC family response regulator
LLADSAQIGLEGLPLSHQSAPGGAVASFRQVLPMREMQRSYASWAFEQLGRNRTRTAERLGIDYKTLSRLLEAGEP